MKQNLPIHPSTPTQCNGGKGRGGYAWPVQPARDVTVSAWPARATSPERRRSHCPSFTHARGVLYMTRRFRRVQAVNSHSVIGQNILRAATRAFRPSADSLRPALDAPRCAAKVWGSAICHERKTFCLRAENFLETSSSVSLPFSKVS